MNLKRLFQILFTINLLSASLSYSSEPEYKQIELTDPQFRTDDGDLYNPFMNKERYHFQNEIKNSSSIGVRFLYDLIHPKNADPSKGRFLIYWKGNGVMRGSTSTAETKHKDKSFGGRTDTGHVGLITSLKSLDCVLDPENNTVINQPMESVLRDIDNILSHRGAINLKVIEVEKSQINTLNREITAAKIAMKAGLNYQILCPEYCTWTIDGYDFGEEIDPLSIEHLKLYNGEKSGGNCASMIYTALRSLSSTIPRYFTSWIVRPYQVYDFNYGPLDTIKNAKEIYSSDDIKDLYFAMQFGNLYKISANLEHTKNGEIAKNLIDNSMKTKWLAPLKYEGHEPRKAKVALSSRYNKDQNRKNINATLLWGSSQKIEPSITFKYHKRFRFLLKSYTLTSGNDHPERDPEEWSVEGSNDGQTWTKIERRSNYKFRERLQQLNLKVQHHDDRYSMFRFTFHRTLGENNSTQLTGLTLDLAEEKF